MALTRREERAARRAAISGSGPSDESGVARFPGATARFALFGEVLAVGLIIVVVGLPLLTLPVAIAAGIRHLRRYLHAEDSRLAVLWRDVRDGLPGGLVVGVCAVALTCLLLLDIDLASSGALPGGVLVAAVGWLGLAAIGVLLIATAAAWTPTDGWRTAIRTALTRVSGDAVGTLYLLATVGFVAVVTWALPPLLIAGLGCTALAAVAIPERSTRLGGGRFTA